jgi:hypothetical protein
MQLTFIATFLSFATADTRIRFGTYTNGNAETNLELNPTVMFAAKNPNGAQIMYEKLTEDEMSAPLVTVYFINTQLNIVHTMMTGFNTVSQTCSCYWVDRNTLKNNKLPSSMNYQLAFVGERAGVERMQTFSGKFGMMWAAGDAEGANGNYTNKPGVPTFTNATPVPSGVETRVAKVETPIVNTNLTTTANSANTISSLPLWSVAVVLALTI